MRRRATVGRKEAKRRHRKPKRGDPAQATRNRQPSGSSQETEIARLTLELHEAQEQQTATAEVLRIISTSPTELQPVLEVVVRSAARFCDANDVTIFELDGQYLRIAAHWGTVPQEIGVRFPCVRGQVAGRAVLDRKPVHVIDLQAEAEEFPEGSAFARRLGHRTTAGVPLLREGIAIGTIVLRRAEVNPFTNKQITLLETFADQAVIAIENVRLFEAEQQRTRELSEALEQQTATSEVLRVISSSPGDLEPVFQSMLANATRICDAKFGMLYLYDGEVFHIAAHYNVPPAFAETQLHKVFRPHPSSGHAQIVLTKQVVHIEDVTATRPYAEGDASVTATADLGGARTIMVIPMVKEDRLIGTMSIFRQEVRPFTDKQIELVGNFANQAVIAIENARLLNELRQSTTDLTESLEQQTATGAILSVISNSLDDTQPVFDAIVQSGVRLFSNAAMSIALPDGDRVNAVAIAEPDPARVEVWRSRWPVPLTRDYLHSAAILDHKVVDIPDARNAPDQPTAGTANFLKTGYRAATIVPMMRGDEAIGAIGVSRTAPGPLSNKQLAVLKAFASQAVIAIENTRLLTELRKRTSELERSYGTVRQQAIQLEAQSQELKQLNQQLEQRVTEQIGEIERMSRLRRFLPPQVADLIVASGTEKQLESHRREITALFCDLRGFTGFSESSDPEDVMALLREYHAAIGQIIIGYSGTLERFAGDGVMVVFNDPVPVDNPALQAVRMALDMRVAIGGLIEKWRQLGHDLGFGIGIAHGYATLGTIGFEGRFDYAAIGTVSNVASRLCDEAKPGQILITPRVLMAVGEVVTAELIEEFVLKGIRRPLAAHNVLALKSAR